MSVSEYKVGLWVKGGEMGWGGEARGGWVRGVGEGFMYAQISPR